MPFLEKPGLTWEKETWLCPSDNVHGVLGIIGTHIHHSTMRGTLRVLPLRNKLGKMCVLPVKVPSVV